MDKNGFQTKVWGSPAWLFLHCIAFNYTPEKAKEYEIFFRSLANVLPCKTCRINYTKLISSGKLRIQKKIFKNRRTFSKWLFLLHNKIQLDIYSRNNKDIPMYTNADYNKVCKIYESFRAKCTKNQYGCTEPYNKGGKKRSIVQIHRFSKNKCQQKYALKLNRN
tara:strand:+ start:230 stop:721 length:492 start_codon:yes stop_codon:yes gene_type:complete